MKLDHRVESLGKHAMVMKVPQALLKRVELLGEPQVAKNMVREIDIRMPNVYVYILREPPLISAMN